MSSITIMTTQGRAQLAAAVANAQSFPSAKIAVGDGNGAIYAPNEAQVGLVHEVWRGNATVARTDDRVIFQAVMPAEVGGFTVREVGVLIGEVGAEQLFIVSQHPSTEKIAAPANGSGPLPITIAFSASAAEQAVLPIGSSDNATLQLSRAPHITVDGLVTEPPAEPADGSLYAIDAGAAGLFVGKGGWLVERVAGAWIYKQPPEKSVIRLAANGAWYQRDGADWAVLTFEDTSILWSQIQDPPAEFPPEPHDHDERYFTEAETTTLLAGKSDTAHLHDGRYVLKAGDAMTGALLMPAGTAGAPSLSASGDTNTGIYFPAADEIALATAGAERMRIKSNGAIGFGTSGPISSYDFAGDVTMRGNILGHAATLGRTFSSDPTGTLSVGAFMQLFGSANATSPGVVAFGNNGQQRLLIANDGAFAIQGDKGTSAKVLVGNASGPPTWQLMSAIFGKKIIAVGYGPGAITFAAAEPDTAYSGLVWNGIISNTAVSESTLRAGTISSKSTTGCTINATAGSGGAGDTFWIIYR